MNKNAPMLGWGDQPKRTYKSEEERMKALRIKDPDAYAQRIMNGIRKRTRKGYSLDPYDDF